MSAIAIVYISVEMPDHIIRGIKSILQRFAFLFYTASARELILKSLESRAKKLIFSLYPNL